MRGSAIPVLLIILGLIGCKNPEIIQLSPGVYMLSRQDHRGIFGNAESMKADVIREANEFASARGKVAIPVSMRETPTAPMHWADITYQFRLVDPGSPAALEGMNTLAPSPTVSIQKIETKETTPPSKDVYAELIKLDDLHKRGILTDAEFEAQKKKLLNGN